jgi:non-heme chloroperoxidase
LDAARCALAEAETDGRKEGMATITVGRENATEIELYYEDRGAGAPVVLVHGFPLASGSWERQARALLQEGHRVITYDRRGSGRSSKPAGGYDWDTRASDLNVLMTTLDVHQAAMAAHSVGAGDVLRYLCVHGAKRVGRAVLVAPLRPIPEDAGAPSGTDVATAHRDAGERYARVSKIVADYYNLDTFLGNRVSAEVVNRSRDICLAASRQIEATWPPGPWTDFRVDLAAIDVPVLVLSAADDRIFPLGEREHRAFGLLPLSKSVVIPSAPHGLLWTHADEVNAALLAFIDD